MKEKINASAIPDAYLLCLNQDCPKATGCLRRIAEQQTSDCPYFRPSGKQTYALGFIGMLEQMPYRQMQEAASRLLNHFGRRTYYRVRKGERPLSPNEQKSILKILEQCHVGDPGKFDAYFETYDW